MQCSTSSSIKDSSFRAKTTLADPIDFYSWSIKSLSCNKPSSSEVTFVGTHIGEDVQGGEGCLDIALRELGTSCFIIALIDMSRKEDSSSVSYKWVFHKKGVSTYCNFYILLYGSCFFGPSQP